MFPRKYYFIDADKPTKYKFVDVLFKQFFPLNIFSMRAAACTLGI